jgi:hypothetical protein
MVLQKRISSNSMIETWLVLRREMNGRRPYLVHFFKYTSVDKDKTETVLNTLCNYIEVFNNQIDNQVENIQFLRCHNGKVQTGKIGDLQFYYWMFEKPSDSFLFHEICSPKCAIERVCRYKIKDFIKGFIKSNINTTDEIWDVKVILNSNTIFYGKLNNLEKDNRRSFVALPYPKIKSVSQLKLDYNKAEEDDNLFKFEEFQSEFGRFLIHMYTGFDNASSEESSGGEFANFNPFNVEFSDSVEIYESLNKSKNHKLLVEDTYFGITRDFIKSYNDKETLKLKDLLQNSFYNFVFNLLNKKFTKMNDILNDKYVNEVVPINRLKSDTILQEEK